MRARIGFVVVPVLALVLWLVYGSGYVDYDAAYALLWGDDIGHGHRPPDLTNPHSPTPHPLATLVSVPLSWFGSGALSALELISVVSFAALGWFAFLLGARLFGRVAGVVLAAILLTRPVLVHQALTANVDVPFLALVLCAFAMEAAQPKRGWPVLAVLTAAGLLRPEAWLLAIAYLIWLGRPVDRRLVALTLAAPVLWALFDWVLAGSPVHSLTHTSDAATRIGRPQGPVRAVRLTPGYLDDFLSWPLVVVGVLAALGALWLRVRKAYVPIAVGALGGLGFLLLGFGQLPLLARYLALPSAMLALLAAGAAGAAWSGAIPRPAAIVATVVAALALAASIPLVAGDVSDDVDFAAAHHDADHALPSLLDAATAKAALDSCRPLEVQFFQTRPIAAYLLGRRPEAIDTGRPERAARGLVLVGKIDRYQALAPGFRPIARNSQWTLAGACAG